MTKSFAFLLSAIAWAATAHAAGPSYTDPTMTDADFPFQGEYVGTRKTEDGVFKVGLQVIALGKGKFHLVEYRGGLPGDGWKKGAEKNELDGELKAGAVAAMGEKIGVRIKDGVATLLSK